MHKITNYFYIDESGAIDNDSSIFILGCIKTDNPNKLESELNNLTKTIRENIYFQEIMPEFNKQGYHAVDNHPDIRAQFYSLLPLLNFRSYFVILNKNDDYFKRMTSQNTADIIYKICISNLLNDRLMKTKLEKNVLCFEQLTFKNSSLKTIVESYVEGLKELDIEYKIVDKSEIKLSLIDYLNYVLFSILKDTSKTQIRMNQNFELIKPKIGSIKYLNTKKYFSRFKKYELTDIINTMAGSLKGNL